jgi:hypothetical protein
MSYRCHSLFRYVLPYFLVIDAPTLVQRHLFAHVLICIGVCAVLSCTVLHSNPQAYGYECGYTGGWCSREQMCRRWRVGFVLWARALMDGNRLRRALPTPALCVQPLARIYSTQCITVSSHSPVAHSLPRHSLSPPYSSHTAQPR